MMSELFVKEMRFALIKGKLGRVPVYGNYCPNCKTSSDNVHGHEGGLEVCTVCQHVFTSNDVKKQIMEFWEKKNRG